MVDQGLGAISSSPGALIGFLQISFMILRWWWSLSFCNLSFSSSLHFIAGSEKLKAIKWISIPSYFFPPSFFTKEDNYFTFPVCFPGKKKHYNILLCSVPPPPTPQSPFPSTLIPLMTVVCLQTACLHAVLTASLIILNSINTIFTTNIKSYSVVTTIKIHILSWKS